MVTRGYKRLQGVTEVTGGCKGLQEVTTGYRGLQRVTRELHVIKRGLHAVTGG